MNDKNILIPLSLMKKIVYLLEHLDLSSYDHVIQNDYTYILSLLNKKQRTIDLHETYSKMITAHDDDKRHDARIEYLRQKHQNFFD